MTILWRHVGGGVHTQNDRGGANVSVLADVVGLMSGLRGGAGDRVSSDASSETARRGSGEPGRGTPPPEGGPPLPVFLSKDTVHDLLPSGEV